MNLSEIKVKSADTNYSIIIGNRILNILSKNKNIVPKN